MTDIEGKKTIVDVTLGKNVSIRDYVNLYGCTIGDNTKIGTFVEIQRGVDIGKNCKISSHSFICEGVHIGDNVFVGHHVVFVNDRYPAAVNADGNLKTNHDWKLEETWVGNRASIGSGAVILCGVHIEDGGTVGAGAVVTHNVHAGTVVAGVPARELP